MIYFRSAISVSLCLILLTAIEVPLLQDQTKDQDAINWTLGSSTSLIGELNPEKLRQVKQSGVDLIEIGWKDLKLDEQSSEVRSAFAKRIYKESLDAGIAVWSTHVPYAVENDISNPDDVRRRTAIARVKEYIDLAIVMRAKHVVLHASETIDERTREVRVLKARQSLQELSRYMKGKGISLAIESLPPDFMGNSSPELLRLIEGIDNVWICFDTNHLVPERGEDFVRAVGNKIATVHISDFDGVQQKHWMPGRGVIDWPKVIEELVKTGYSGPFMYEVVRREGEHHTFKDLKGNYEMLKKAWTDAK